jgi:integrase
MHLPAEDVERWLKAFDRQSPRGKRDYAMARCLADLGLRACEVAALRLDDVSWAAGTMTIKPGKSRRTDVLPAWSAERCAGPPRAATFPSAGAALMSCGIRLQPRLLDGGASRKEIADLLRHRSLNTTAIYAKVDVTRLM